MSKGEHRAECFQIAEGRRKRGLPSWSETLDLKDVFHDEDKTFIERRDEIVRRVKETKWYRRLNESLPEWDCIESLAESEDTEDFDYYWSDFYDYADFARIWVKTF